ncbi:lactonase family protein [Capnocytophaga genosp. AHN8471]|uniref:Lactonase family protein n=1 Tax=Capnocytophaga genosp. AHN8471 TaxID=327574 RepID=A0ABS1YVF0_9FLAO|nr:lactonase family protein [Capnocytophaga genosp. AHN8471]MBM0650374.1 lactonase family protein [Capnocytophaga genosp. AHN8471]MBM0662230.1 lactonase family protein [Capnocytophaga genosp. AHN8471]
MKKLQTFLTIVFALLTFITFAQDNNLMMYIGSYTEESNSKGIYTYHFNQENGTFELLSSASAGNPSFVTLSPDEKRLYAVSEYNDGRQGAYSFDVSEDKVQLSNPIFLPTAPKESLPRAGADPCHIVTDGKYVITANYTGGDISVFSLDAEGKLKAETQHIAFVGKTPKRVAHIHCIIPTPDKKYILATDLGNDRVYRFRYNKKARKNTEVLTAQRVAYEVSDGQGPRHLTFSKDGHFAYLINELGGECVVLSYRKGKLKEVQRLMADEGGGRGSADIHISPDGRFLYTSHRLKKDGIAIFAIDPKKGTLTKIGYQLTGIHPRNFAITPNGKYLLVACRDDNRIQVFERNEETGELTETPEEIEIDKPTCIVFGKSN